MQPSWEMAEPRLKPERRSLEPILCSAETNARRCSISVGYHSSKYLSKRLYSSWEDKKKGTLKR